MMALHVSWSTDIARRYQMRMNRAQQSVAIMIALVYGLIQISRNAAVFSQASFCTDSRLSPPFTESTGSSMLAFIGVAFGLGKGVWGPAVDKYEASVVFLGLTLGLIFCTVLFTFMTSMHLIIAVFCLSGFLQAGLWPGTTAMTAKWFKGPQLGRCFAIRGLGSRLGTIAASWVVGALLTVYDWPSAVRGAAACTTLGLALGVAFLKEPQRLAESYSFCATREALAAQKPQPQPQPQPEPELEVEEGDAAPTSGGGAPLKAWMKDSRFWTMNLMNICVGVIRTPFLVSHLCPATSLRAGADVHRGPGSGLRQRGAQAGGIHLGAPALHRLLRHRDQHPRLRPILGEEEPRDSAPAHGGDARRLRWGVPADARPRGLHLVFGGLHGAGCERLRRRRGGGGGCGRGVQQLRGEQQRCGRRWR